MPARAMRCRKMVWNDEQNERLKAMVSQGVSVLRAAAIFNCSTITIRSQARKLGMPFPTVREARKKFANDPQSSWRFH